MEEYLPTDTNNLTCDESLLGPKRDSLYIIIPIIIIYIVIFLTGTIGNISTCIVISKNKSMHTATNYYLFSLAISDLLLLVSGLPQEIYLIYSRYPYIFGSAFCFLRGLFAETSANATVLTITAFTVERYLAICHPFLSHTMSKLSRAVKLILIIWLVATCLAIPQAMQFKVIGPPECESCKFMEPIIEHSFEVSTLLFFVLPMTLITVLYVLIGQRLKSSTILTKRNTNARIQSKSSRRVVKMLVAVVVAFFICWAPFHAQRLYTTLLQSQLSENEPPHPFYVKIYEIVTYASGILYYMSATINPILYNIMSVKFREAFKETFARFCGLGHFKTSHCPERSYSVLSRSAQRGPDSTDSGRDEATLHTHTTITQKSSIESVNGGGIIAQNSLRRNRTFSTLRGSEIEEENSQTMDWLTEVSDYRSPSGTMNNNKKAKKLISVHINPSSDRKKANNKFWHYFECIAKRTFDDSKRLSGYYSFPAKQTSGGILLELEHKGKNRRRCNGRLEKNSCDISNSSLKDIEQGAIDDELKTYLSSQPNFSN